MIEYVLIVWLSGAMPMPVAAERYRSKTACTEAARHIDDPVQLSIRAPFCLAIQAPPK